MHKTLQVNNVVDHHHHLCGCKNKHSSENKEDYVHTRLPKEMDRKWRQMMVINKKFICPLTNQFINVPAYLSKDIKKTLYERDALETWLDVSSDDLYICEASNDSICELKQYQQRKTMEILQLVTELLQYGALVEAIKLLKVGLKINNNTTDRRDEIIHQTRLCEELLSRGVNPGRTSCD